MEEGVASTDQVILFMATHDDGQTQNNSSQPTHHSNTITTTPRSPTTLRKRRTTLRRLSMSKPRARNVEFNLPTHTLKPIEPDPDHDDNPLFEPNQQHSTSDFTTSDEEDLDDDDEEGNEGTYHKMRKKKRKINFKKIIEWTLFFISLTSLILTVTVKSLEKQVALGLQPWQCCVMITVVVSGRLCSEWMIKIMVFMIERNFMLREKVLYFVYGLRKSIQNVVWLGFVLIAWTFVFDASDVDYKKHKMLKKMSAFLLAVVIGAVVWLIKIVLVKTLASSFHVRTYFDRIKESVFHHYILDTLSGPPMDEALMEEEHKKAIKKGSKSLPRNWKEAKNGYKTKKFGTRKIDLEKLKELSMESPTSIWSMKRLMNYIRSSGLSTITKTVDEFGKSESEITSEWEATNTAKRIFRHVAKRGAKYIEEEDLARFLKRVEIHAIFPLFQGALETGRITKSTFRNWVVRAYFERKALAHSLNDTKTAVQQLHKLASAIVSVIILVIALLVMGFATPKVVGLVVTQMLVLGFIFHNTCKTIFECIIFVFVMHPFDIGDRCKIDGVQLIVEEMNILSTVFLRYDMEKIYYPNSALLNKPISNFYRSPEMADGVPFNIDASTPLETINALKKAIQSYIDSKPNYWNPKHSIIVKEIEDLSTLKMNLCVQHTMNHQNFGERNVRMTELILEMKRIFENLNIKYHLLPQEVHLTKFNIENSTFPVPF